MTQTEINHPIIETERLFLREMTCDDFDALYGVLTDSDIMRHYPYTFDEKRVRGWISKNPERYRIFGFGLWAVCLKSTGEMIGDCGLTTSYMKKDNLASAAVARANGMIKSYEFADPEGELTVVYEITRKDWELR